MRSLKMLSAFAALLGLALAATLAQAQQQQQQRPQQPQQQQQRQEMQREMQQRGQMTTRGDIVETARSAGQFNTLVEALEKSGLANDLRREGPYTIFAPTDEAFQKLGQQQVDDLMKPENKERLAQILRYHVVPDEVTTQEVSGKKTRAETLEGSRLQIDATKPRDLKVNDARVTGPDIDATNGVIHPIDKVLMPRRG